jgi:hypothetical protein
MMVKIVHKDMIGEITVDEDERYCKAFSKAEV